jgi:predicted phosphate transport protein (TIGR00153 family)
MGKKRVFYELLEKQALAANKAAQTLQKMTNDFGSLSKHATKIKEIESETDQTTHELANKIDSTFVTPLDKEDLHTLSNELDNITDTIEACSGRLALYQLAHPRPDLAGLADKLVKITGVVAEMVGMLHNKPNREKMQPFFTRIHQIENEHDGAFRNALAALLNAPDAAPIEVIKWKEIYDRLETAVDQCQDVAKIVESVVVKYA